ncbi:MAG: DEAD/DEAH box helicase family protein, partial [Acholeplasmataceae bacterium]|nr:DEAD/DEAH box helicase family protein [Acholeplasmataceae bacterium]
MFNLKAPFTPKGDQIKAIEILKENIGDGIKRQVLLGATGTGKTFTIANMIQALQKKTLILA